MSIIERARPEILQLKPYASARAVAGDAPVMLNANERPWPGAGDENLALNRYPAPQPWLLVERLAALYQVPADQLLVTRGSDEAIDLLVRVFCRAGEDAVVITPPTFGMYEIAARIQHAGVIRVPLDETQDFALDRDALLAAITPAVKIVFLCSPNNPTGSEIDGTEIRAIAERLAGQCLVLVDEAYIEFSDHESLTAAVSEQPNLAVLRTLSKAHGLAGARCGSLIADPAVVDLVRRVMPPYPLPSPTVAAALTALTPTRLAHSRRQVAELKQLRSRLETLLDSRPFIDRYWAGAGNFVLLRLAPGWSGLDRFAARQGVLLRRLELPERTLRISVGSEAELERLATVLDAFQAQGTPETMQTTGDRGR